MEHELTWLRSYVLRCLEDAFGEPPELDGAGEPAFRQGTAVCFVTCHDPGFPVVSVSAMAVLRVRSSAKLLKEINDVNARTQTAHVYYDDTVVHVEQNLHAYGVNDQTLGQAVLAVSKLANDIGSLMAMTFGGDTPYPTEEEADARDEAA